MTEDEQALISAGTHVRVVVHGDNAIALPVVYRTRRGTYAVVDNRRRALDMSFDPARRNMYIVVHVATGLRVPRPSSIEKMTRRYAGQVARGMEDAGFIDPTTGQPAFGASDVEAMFAALTARLNQDRFRKRTR